MGVGERASKGGDGRLPKGFSGGREVFFLMSGACRDWVSAASGMSDQEAIGALALACAVLPWPGEKGPSKVFFVRLTSLLEAVSVSPSGRQAGLSDRKGHARVSFGRMCGSVEMLDALERRVEACCAKRGSVVVMGELEFFGAISKTSSEAWSETVPEACCRMAGGFGYGAVLEEIGSSEIRASLAGKGVVPGGSIALAKEGGWVRG